MESAINKVLARKINSLAVKDQQMRKNWGKKGLWDKSVDQRNTRILKKIIKEYGWPARGLVGKKASFNAWLLAQHADHDIRFQKRVLKLMEVLYRNNPKDIDKKNIAFITDRILVHEGKKQIFGTQFYKTKDGKLEPNLISGRKNLNKRRKEYNLPPFKEYEKAMRQYNRMPTTNKKPA